MNIAVIGLGKLGLCTAACMASKGHRVIGVDANAQVVSRLRAGECPIRENGLSEMLQQASVNLTVTTDIVDAVRRSDVTMIIVPTPSGPDGRFSNESVKAALSAIGKALTSAARFHVVDVVSTVMPGSCDKEFRPLLEKSSRLVCGRDFGLVYNPEFIALGSVIRDFMRPDMVLIGASDASSADIIREVYQTTCDNAPNIAAMSLLNAEITKLSLNCFVTTKISFANELAAICGEVDGADIDVITAALGTDTRIGHKYLRGGLGFAGPCFPRDNAAFRKFAEEAGCHARLSEATIAINNDVVGRLMRIVTARVAAGEKVALLGMSYKPHTHVIAQSQSVELANRLSTAGYLVSVHDPSALDETARLLGAAVEYCTDPQSCVAQSAAVVLLTCWPEYSALRWQELDCSAARSTLLLDCWRQLKDRQWSRFEYIGLGIGHRAAELAGV